MSNTTVQILINQNGNSNKIWAQVGRLPRTANGSGKHMVVHGPIRKDGGGLVENESSAIWQDKQRKGYEFLATFENVPEGMERACVSGVAHVLSGFSPDTFMGRGGQETAFGRNCGKRFQRKSRLSGVGLTINLATDDGRQEPEKPVQEPVKQALKQDLGNLLKSKRESGYF